MGASDTTTTDTIELLKRDDVMSQYSVGRGNSGKHVTIFHI